MFSNKWVAAVVLLSTYSIQLSAQELAVHSSCFHGQWQYDAGESDNQNRVINKLKRHLKREASTQYPRKTREEKPLSEVNLPDSIPQIAFLAEDISIASDSLQLHIMSKSLHRDINLSGKSKAYSLKNFDSKNRTVIASINDGIIYIDSKLVSGLTVQEALQLIKPNTLHHFIELKDGIEKPIKVNRYYQRMGEIEPSCDINLHLLIGKP